MVCGYFLPTRNIFVFLTLKEEAEKEYFHHCYLLSRTLFYKLCRNRVNKGPLGCTVAIGKSNIANSIHRFRYIANVFN